MMKNKPGKEPAEDKPEVKKPDEGKSEEKEPLDADALTLARLRCLYDAAEGPPDEMFNEPRTPVALKRKSRGLVDSPYPSSSSESSLPSPMSVLAMPVRAEPPAVFPRPGKKTKGRVPTLQPGYRDCIYPKGKPCCQHRCQKPVGSEYYEIVDVLSVRMFWFSLGPTDRRQFLANRIQLGFGEHGSGQEQMKKYFLEDRQVLRDDGLKLGGSSLRRVCRRFFMFAIGTTTGGIYQYSVNSKDFTVHPVTAQVRKRPKAVAIEAWLSDFATYYQISPDNDYIYLPYANRATVYQLYKAEVIAVPGLPPPAKEAYFMRVWRVTVALQFVRIRKWLRFATCDYCVDYRKRREETSEHSLREAIKADELLHHAFVQGERGSYYKRQTRAEVHPRKYFSVIIDGSDNSQYWSPYFRERTSTSQSSWKVGLHVMGAVVHGRRAYAYTILDTCPLGANVTIDILHRVMVAEIEANGVLPKILYIQLDNTTRQCKNKYVLGWLAYLVQIGIFDEVFVSFLPKGHTHEDIDQMFSCIAKWLRGHDCLSPASFSDAVHCAYKFNGLHAKCEHLTHVANISDFIAGVNSAYLVELTYLD
jgi:hypothetical protein